MPFAGGVRSGRGLFETIRVCNDGVQHLQRHLHRLAAPASTVGFAVPWWRMDDGIFAALGRWGAAPGRMRLTVTASGHVAITIHALPPFPEAAHLVVNPWPRNERDPLCHAKSISQSSNALAFERAAARGADEALFIDTRGNVSEGSRTNIFAVFGEQLLTPPLACGCLPGVTRALILDYMDAREQSFTVAELCRADEAFLTSSLRGAQAIAAIDDHAFAALRPVTRRVSEGLGALSADA